MSNSEHPETFNNEDLNVVVTKQPNCQVKFDISVKPHAVVAAYATAIKNVNKNISLPGFRKGRAPEKLVMEKYKPDIQKEWIDTVLQTSFNEAVQLTKIFPLRDGHMKRPVMKECSQEKGAHFIIEFEVQPQIPDIKAEDLKIQVVKPQTISKEQEERALKQVCRQFINFQPITDRGVEEGDFIDLDLEILEEPEPRKVVNNQRVEVTQESVPAWVLEKIMGLKAGESVEGETEASQSDEDPNFVPRAFRATVKAIWDGQMPALDDELAKKVGASSIEDLKTKIRDRLTRESQEEIHAKQMEELDNALLSTYQFDLPRSLIEQNTQPRIKEFREQMKSQQGPKPDQAKVEKAIEEGVVRGLKLFLLLRKVAVDEQIELTEADMQEEFKHQVYLASSGRQSANIFGNKEHMQEQLYNLALDKKVKQFLLDKATSGSKE